MRNAWNQALWSRPARIVWFAVAYFLLGKLSYWAAYFPEGALAVWWAPSGLALATMVRADRRSLPWYSAAILVTATVINLVQPIGVYSLLYRSVADLLEPLTAALLLRRRFGRDLGLRTLKEVTGFALIGGLLGPAVGTVIAGAGFFTRTGSPGEAGRFALVWFGSAVLGAMLFAPVMLTWRAPLRWPRRSRMVEAALLSVALIGVTGGALFLPTQSSLTILVGFAAFPLLIWAAGRFGPPGTARAAVALSLLSLWPILTKHLTVAPWQIILTQGIFAFGVLSALTFSALMLETRHLHARAESHARRAEESLALLESALRGAPFAIAFFDPASRILRANEVFAGLGKHSPDALRGLTLAEALPDEAERLEPVLKSILTQGRVLEEEVETVSEGTTRWWLASAFPVKGGLEEAIGAGLLMMDVTERKANAEERDRLFREAEEAVRVREDFLSIASHELKTPLTPLAVRLSAIKRRLAAGETIPPESIDKPMQSLRKMTELINDLLDASRIEHGRLMIQLEPQPLEDIVRASAAPFRGASPLHPLVLDIHDEPLWVDADRERLSQVIANLLDNAIKYSPSGGDVRVSVRPHPEGVEIVVSDRGIGIPPEQRDRLFERFYRAANASVTSYGGLGLGLYITRDIVDRHGGRIWAESRPGEGSSFHVVLPRILHADLRDALH